MGATACLERTSQAVRNEFFQIDNEPMNNGFTPDAYAEIVNVYGSRLRAVAPQARIIACGQKRSNDMGGSEKVIDLAGKNFDILGCHNYEYEPENFEPGLRRIRDYFTKLRDNMRGSKQVVGNSGICGVGGHAFLWENGGPAVNLDSLVLPGSDLQVINAFFINDAGEIVCRGKLANGDRHASPADPRRRG